MTKLLIRLFVKNKDDRESYSFLSGGTGIFCNLLLTVVKFAIGLFTNSVSITADAANNLSDASSSVVTIVGAKIAKKPVDEDHPFGHGRAEYISAMIVSFLIFLMGIELAKSSIEKIFEPQDVLFSWPAFIVLVITIPVKLWMSYFNHRLYKITGNENMKAVRQDSLNDCIATGATIISLLISAFTKFNIDGYIGIAVAIVILLAGFNIIKDISSNLLGKAPDPALVNKIKSTMLDADEIVGVHDLIVHDYGPGKIIASAHAEVPADMDMMKIHDVIDNVERKISHDLHIVMCIHMDPIATNDETVQKYRELMKEVLHEYNASFSFHDFRIVKGETHTNLIFDLVTPKTYQGSSAKILTELQDLVWKKDKTLNIVATVEHTFLQD